MGERKEEVAVFVDDVESQVASGIPFCRICHEIEFESCKTLEAPCSCSGTVKFAHRDCIQRWCEEKGDTTCEICLQNFEPGYTAPVQKVQLVDGAVTIRGSLEVPRRRGQGSDLEEQLIESEFSSNSWNWFRVVASIFTVLFLLRHVSALLIGGGEDYPFALLTLAIAKMSGVALPIYVMIRVVASIYKSFRNRQHQYEAPEVESSSESGQVEAEDHVEHRVEIHSS
ncbi:Ubiquitin--protein ligase [Heracleum sosnowskyi]|uniref:Ubiquitin--protein ligase n=1 Tax=Heracleum sosnowskyi TaxID=360622 RepID=A0AAD8IHH4_9APIA|nr:Ubiquitin--protein ligase [Heracleum sosnowskyi]